MPFIVVLLKSSDQSIDVKRALGSPRPQLSRTPAPARKPKFKSSKTPKPFLKPKFETKTKVKEEPRDDFFQIGNSNAVEHSDHHIHQHDHLHAHKGFHK